MEQHTQIGLIGDIMLGDSPLRNGYGIYSELHGVYTAVFSEFSKFADRFDFVIGNFEAVLVESIESDNLPGTLGMQVPRSAIECLNDCKIRFLSVANNHTMEFGGERFRAMCRFFTEQGIRTFGHKEKPYIIIESNGRRIGVLGFSTIPAFYGYEPEYYFLDPEREEDTCRLLATVREARACCDYLIVFPHWGCEFVIDPSASQIALAKRLIAAGADLIAGAHPHVIQTPCRIDERPVIFSLGNFVCDYWQSRLRESICVQIEIVTEPHIKLHTLRSGKDYIVRPIEESSLTFASEPNAVAPEVYAKRAHRERSRVRKETLLFLAAKICSVLRSPTLMKWIYRRIVFLIKNGRSIKADPLKVYAQE